MLRWLMRLLGFRARLPLVLYVTDLPEAESRAFADWVRSRDDAEVDRIWLAPRVGGGTDITIKVRLSDDSFSDVRDRAWKILEEFRKRGGEA